MTDSLVDAFRQVDTSDISPIDVCDGDSKLQALWVLWVAQERLNTPVLRPTEISVVLRDVYGHHVPRQRIEADLSKDRRAVAPRKVNGKRGYQIMAPGIAEVSQAGPRVTFIDPAAALSSVRDVQDLLSGLGGHLRVCDPYIDPRTLDFVAECVAAQSIKLLSYNVRKLDSLKRDLKPLRKQLNVPIALRQAKQSVLHDRYVVHKGGVLLLGTSLNGIGLKQSFAVSLGPDMSAAVSAAFDTHWASATVLTE